MTELLARSKTKHTLRQMPVGWEDNVPSGMLVSFSFTSQQALQIPGSPVLKSSRELQQLQLSKNNGFCHPIVLGSSYSIELIRRVVTQWCQIYKPSCSRHFWPLLVRFWFMNPKLSFILGDHFKYLNIIIHSSQNHVLDLLAPLSELAREYWSRSTVPAL